MKTTVVYHSADYDGIFCREIATKNGGGGHRGACGFTFEKLPFALA